MTTELLKYVHVDSCDYSKQEALLSAFHTVRLIMGSQAYKPVKPGVLMCAQEYDLMFNAQNSTFNLHSEGKNTLCLDCTAKLFLRIEKHKDAQDMHLIKFDIFNVNHIRALSKVIEKFDLGLIPMDEDLGEYRIEFLGTTAVIKRSVPSEIAAFCVKADIDMSDVVVADALIKLHRKGLIGVLQDAEQATSILDVCDSRKLEDFTGDSDWILEDVDMLNADFRSSLLKFTQTEVKALFTHTHPMVSQWVYNARYFHATDVAVWPLACGITNICVGFYIEDLTDDQGNISDGSDYALKLHMFMFSEGVFETVKTATPESLNLKIHTVRVHHASSLQAALGSILFGPNIEGYPVTGLLRGATLLKAGKPLLKSLKATNNK